MSTIAIPPTIPSDANHSSVHLNKANVTKGTVTQLTDVTTTVVVNAAAGVITMFTSTLAADATEAFTVTNSSCSATSVVLANGLGLTGAGGATAVITVNVEDVAEGSFVIRIGNGSAVALNGILTVGFLIV